VSALGFGLLSVVPSGANANAVLSIGQAPIRAGVASIVTLAANTTPSANFGGPRFTLSTTGDLAFAAGSTSAWTQAITDWDSGTAGNQAGVIPAQLGALVLTAPTGATLAAGSALYAGTGAGATTTSITSAAGATLALYSFSAGAASTTNFDTAGTYTMRIWANTNTTGTPAVIDALEPTADVTFTVGSTPSTIALSSASGSQEVQNFDGLFSVSLTDAAGRATTLSGSETLTVSDNNPNSNAADVTFADNDTVENPVSSNTTGALTIKAPTVANAANNLSVSASAIKIYSSTAGSYTISVASNIAGIVPKNFALTVGAKSAVSSDDVLAITTSSNVVAGTNVVSAPLTTTPYTVNPSVTTLTVTVSNAEANKGVQIFVDPD